MLIGVDLSHYQKTPDFEVMKQGGVRFSVPRCSQGNFITDNAFPSHYRASRDAKLITGTFHYIDPTSTCTGINEAHYVVNILKDWPVDFMAPDFEKGRDNSGGKIQSTKLDARLRDFYGEFHVMMPSVTIIPYTRTSFLEEFSPRTINSGWLRDKPLWLAQYPESGMARRISWEELRGKIPNYRQPTLPKNCSGYTIWQFSGDLWILPGSNDHPIETDLFNGSWADMLKLCNLPLDTAEPLPGDAIVDPLPAAVEMKVLWYVQYLNVRTGPGTQFQVSKYLRGNDRIVVDGRTINDLWVKYADANLYVRSSYLKRV